MEEYDDMIEHDDSPEFLRDVEWFDTDISGDWLDPTKAYSRPKYTLSFNGVKFAPLGGIHALTGQPGNGKTMTFAQFIVAILKGEWGGLKYELSEEKPTPTVLYIDTEMEEGNTQLVQLRVYEMMGWAKGQVYEQFKVLRLRETDRAEDRWRKTLRAIYEVNGDDVKNGKLTVCFIDGLLDVVADFNKNEECQKLIYQCMKTASHYGISLWCLVHENPGTTKMVGHLGSMLERKVTDSFGTIKEKNGNNVSFKIVQKKARGKDIEDINFHVVDGPNGFGIPEQFIDESGPHIHTRKYLEDLFFGLKDDVEWPASKNSIRKKMDGSTDQKQLDINEAINLGILKEDGKGHKDCPLYSLS